MNFCKIFICCRTDPNEHLLFQKIFSKRYRSPGRRPGMSENSRKTPSVNFASLLWKIGPMNLAKKLFLDVRDYSEQLWFHKIFPKYYTREVIGFLARTVKTRQIAEAKIMFFWVLKAFRRFFWLENSIQKCGKYFFTSDSVIGSHVCWTLQPRAIETKGDPQT